MIAGRPTSSSAPTASSRLCTRRLRGDSRPIASIASRNLRRSSALAITSGLAPISSMPRLSRNGRPSSRRHSASAIAVFSAVCPPMVGSRASGRSFSRMRATVAGVIGSM